MPVAHPPAIATDDDIQPYCRPAQTPDSEFRKLGSYHSCALPLAMVSILENVSIVSTSDSIVTLLSVNIVVLHLHARETSHREAASYTKIQYTAPAYVSDDISAKMGYSGNQRQERLCHWFDTCREANDSACADQSMTRPEMRIKVCAARPRVARGLHSG